MGVNHTGHTPGSAAPPASDVVDDDDVVLAPTDLSIPLETVPDPYARVTDVDVDWAAQVGYNAATDCTDHYDGYSDAQPGGRSSLERLECNQLTGEGRDHAWFGDHVVPAVERRIDHDPGDVRSHVARQVLCDAFWTGVTAKMRGESRPTAVAPE